MQILLKKGEHKALLNTRENLVSMVTWQKIAREKFITGIITDKTSTELEARALFRKMSKLMQDNSYKLITK